MPDHKLVEIEPGDYLGRVADIEYEQEKWEAYDFTQKEWIPSENVEFSCIVPYPYRNGATFLEALQEVIQVLPPETTVYYYHSNESFAAIRPKLTENPK